ncbi:hypothetical protein ACFQ7I_32770 [Streptomyces massasporeus]
MPKKKFALFSAAGTAVLVLGATALLTAPAHAGPEKVIDLDVGNDGVVKTDVGEHGLSVGDEFLYADKLYQGGKQVGKDGSSCQVTQLVGEKITTNCVLSVQLPDGQITAQSLWTKGDDTVRMAVTGGTGAYRGASGELSCYDIQTPHETYRITLDKP